MSVGSDSELAGGSPRYFAASSDTGDILAHTLGASSASQSFTKLEADLKSYLQVDVSPFREASRGLRPL